jgi:hypothetical protein
MMGKDLVPVEPAVEGEVYHMSVDAIFDEYVDFLPADEIEVTTSLDEADEQALARGIATVFDTLLAEAHEVEPTYALLAELNRIWAEPLAA